jgi:tetrahydromethanopterin S-methyltransferase subunit G
MSVVEDVRQVLQDFLAPELREIRGRLDSIDKRLDGQDKHFDTLESAYNVRYQALVQRLDAIENANGVRYQAIVQRLEQIQQSFAFDKRISDLEAEKTRSA